MDRQEIVEEWAIELFSADDENNEYTWDEVGESIKSGYRDIADGDYEYWSAKFNQPSLDESGLRLNIANHLRSSPYVNTFGFNYDRLAGEIVALLRPREMKRPENPYLKLENYNPANMERIDWLRGDIRDTFSVSAGMFYTNVRDIVRWCMALFTF